jgi:predicted nucleic acid-binding protein
VSFYELLSSVRDGRRLRKVEEFATEFAVLPADYGVCAMAGAMQARLSDAGQMIPVLDAIIAATAVRAGLPVVTSDDHFRRIPRDFGLAVQGYGAVGLSMPSRR